MSVLKITVPCELKPYRPDVKLSTILPGTIFRGKIDGKRTGFLLRLNNYRVLVLSEENELYNRWSVDIYDSTTIVYNYEEFPDCELIIRDVK